MAIAPRKYFILRQHYEEDIRNELYNEIKLGRYRQGWGLNGMDLTQNIDNWVSNYIEAGRKALWRDEDLTEQKAKDRYWILFPMLEIKSEDIILVPKQPKDDYFIIAQAKEINGKVYYFDNEDESKRGILGNDFRHVINIEPETIKEFQYETDINTLQVKKKMRAYQKAVNNIWDNDLKKVIYTLFATPEKKFPTLNIMEIMKKAISDSDIYRKILVEIRKLPPNKLEELIERLFKDAGLEVIGRNIYDRKGGDIDRIFKMAINLPPLVEMMSSDIAPHLIFNIQIKQKKGVVLDDKKFIEQLIRMKSGGENEYGILISTQDDFSDECKKLAEQNKVILINGLKLAEILVKIS